MTAPRQLVIPTFAETIAGQAYDQLAGRPKLTVTCDGVGRYTLRRTSRAVTWEPSGAERVRVRGWAWAAKSGWRETSDTLTDTIAGLAVAIHAADIAPRVDTA